nr:hypothetical protein [Tanacetum cinerariifolium]
MESCILAGIDRKKGGKRGFVFGRETLCIAQCFERKDEDDGYYFSFYTIGPWEQCLSLWSQNTKQPFFGHNSCHFSATTTTPPDPDHLTAVAAAITTAAIASRRTTSRDLWLSLKKAYAPHSTSREYTLKTQLLRIKMHGNETPDVYLNRAQEYADALVANGEPVKDKDLAMLVVSDTGANSHVTLDLEAMDNSEAYYGDDTLHVGNECSTDRGGEFRNLASFFSSLGIIHRRSCPHTSEQNGFVEHRNRHVVETGLTLLAQACVPQRFWHYAFDTVFYLINRMPSLTPTNKSPFEHIFKRSPDNSSSCFWVPMFSSSSSVQSSQNGFSFHSVTISLRAVLSLAITNDWPLRQLDIQNAFLYGNLKEQASRAWFERLSKALFDLDFKGSKMDPSLFIYSRGDTLFYILVYVDDIIVTCNNKCTIDNIICQLGSAFALKELGPLNYFLGIEIVPHVSGILLFQKKNILELLQSVDLSNCNPVSSPTVTSSSLSLDDNTAFSNPVKYQQVVGYLQYVTLSRPDIGFAVNKVCQFMHVLIENHWYAVKWILRYLHGTIEHGMLIRRSSGSTIQAFTDVLWKAEYKALADTVAELTWIQALLNELGIRSSSTSILWCDNLGATYLSPNPIFHARTKHVEIDYHFVQEKVFGFVHGRSFFWRRVGISFLFLVAIAPKKKVRGPTKKKAIWNLKSHEKVVVTFNELAQPIGDKANELTKFLGTLVRMSQHIGIQYEEWKKVHDVKKEDLWSIVKEKFIFEPAETAEIKDWI